MVGRVGLNAPIGWFLVGAPVPRWPMRQPMVTAFMGV